MLRVWGTLETEPSVVEMRAAEATATLDVVLDEANEVMDRLPGRPLRHDGTTGRSAIDSAEGDRPS